jgi:hypothetical protein
MNATTIHTPSADRTLSVDVRQLIAEFKVKIDALLSDLLTPVPDMLWVLMHLEHAEKLAGSVLPWRRAQAWHELEQAKLAFRQALEMSTNGTQPTADVTNIKNDMLWREWHDVKADLLIVQRRHAHVNIEDTINWLMWAEEALEKDKCDESRAMYCILQSRCSLVYAEECIKWTAQGLCAILIELAYLFLLPVGLLLYARSHGFTFESVVTDSVTVMMTGAVLHIPCYVYLWGFLGGTTWCLNYAALWSKKRLFDSHYLGWYIAHPWISAVLGGAVSLIILGGISSMSTTAPATPTAAALLSLVSFVAGFSTNSMWKLLDRTVRKILGDESTMVKMHAAAPSLVVDDIKKH